MVGNLGQSVPKVKAIVSHDFVRAVGQSVLMDDADEDLAETEWRAAFAARIRAYQGDRTNETMGELLGIDGNRYSKYTGKRASQMPIRLLPRLAKIFGISLVELIEGPKVAMPKAQPRKRGRKKSAA